MTNTTCALCGESSTESRATVVVHVDDSERRWPMHMHPSCLTAFLVADIPPLAPDRSVRIPRNAACGVCGGRLPIIGRHPYAVSVEEAGRDRTWFVHAECLPDSLRARMSNAEG